MEIAVIIPTHGRAGRVTTLDAVANAKLCVAESQAPAYREHYPRAEFVIHPESVIGLSPKRQWIYEKFGNVFMLDDDVTHCQRVYLHSKKAAAMKLTPEEAYWRIQDNGNLARLAGCYLFGFNKDPNPTHYNPGIPLRLVGFVTGCALGILEGSKLSFNPRSTAVEDFYISGLNAHYHRKAWIDTRFGFVQKDTFSNVGGQASFRTVETERQDLLFLRECFGDAIRRKIPKKAGGSTKSPYGRTIVFPF